MTDIRRRIVVFPSRLRIAIAAPALAAAALAAVPASAHHSVAAFALNKRSAVSGTVTKFEWQNPHSWVFIDAVVKGKVVKFGFELGPPAALRRAALRYDAINEGDKVRIEFAPAKDGSNTGLLTRIVWTGQADKSWAPTGSASPIMPGGVAPTIVAIN